MRDTTKEFFKENGKTIGEVVLGSAIYSLGMNLFYTPAKLLAGGVAGFAQLLPGKIPIDGRDRDLRLTDALRSDPSRLIHLRDGGIRGDNGELVGLTEADGDIQLRLHALEERDLLRANSEDQIGLRCKVRQTDNGSVFRAEFAQKDGCVDPEGRHGPGLRDLLHVDRVQLCGGSVIISQIEMGAVRVIVGRGPFRPAGAYVFHRVSPDQRIHKL